MKFGSLFLLVVAVVGIASAPEIVRLFRKEDAEVVRIGAAALMIISNMMLQTIRKPGKAILLASAKQGLFFIPLIFLLTANFGLLGVEISQSAADLCALALAIPLTTGVLRKMK